MLTAGGARTSNTGRTSTRAKQATMLPFGEATSGLVQRTIQVAAAEVVFVKGILEASEGIAAMFAERGGTLLICAPPSRATELDELLRDLCDELGATCAADKEATCVSTPSEP